MDQIRIGKFIAKLRREAELTQEALGERLGVTNKTISRWENGNYMPDIEMLQLLSREFEVSINELLTGERIPEEEYRAKAEENISAVLSRSAFSLEEKTAFFKRKWRREHLAQIIILPVVLLVIAVLALINRQPLFLALLPVLGLTGYGYLRNRMMAYVEHSIYD